MRQELCGDPPVEYEYEYENENEDEDEDEDENENDGQKYGRRGEGLATLLCSLILTALFCSIVFADDSPPDPDLAARSLPLRTALHHDPTLAAPLDRLLEMYRQAGHAEDLAAMYRAHLAQYPQDGSARIVLIRLLAAGGDPEAARLARGAVEASPDDAYLRYLLYLSLRAAHDAGALAELDRAIERETSAERRLAWIDILLPDAVAADRRDLAEKHLRALGGLPGLSADARLEAARKMIQFGFCAPALEVLQAAAAAAPSPETGVEIEMAAASAEVGLDRAEAAAARLDRLLEKLTADYWRRPEIVRRRIALVKTDAEREGRVQAAQALVSAHPGDESAALDLAQCLAGFERRREALDALLAAGQRLPGSPRIEKETLDLFDRLRDERGREKYLAARAGAFPERRDLARMRARSLYLLGRRKEAQTDFDLVLQGLPESERPGALVELARELRRASFTLDASDLFRRAVDLAPGRLELRRELAETLLALGEKSKARALFPGTFPDDTPADVVIDAVRFMVAQELLTPARSAVAGLLRREPAHLEARLLAVEIDGRRGNRTEGEAEILRARMLADTGPRYLLWLEACAAFHDRFQSAEGFLEAEQNRLVEETGEWTAVQVDRRLAFAEVAARLGRKAEAAGMLAADLERDLRAEARVALRRRLMTLIEDDAAQASEVEAQLAALTQEDPAHADEYGARLALLHLKAERADLAEPWLKRVRVAGILDPGVLGALEGAYRARGDRARVLEILERLTAIDSTGRAGWERRLTALATSGDETQLRATLRRLLSGIDGMPIADECTALLRLHLVDSYWRSIAATLADGRAAPMADALALVDEVERSAQEPTQALWAAWTRALLLNRLGRTKERDEAIAEVERLRAEVAKPPEGEEAAKPDEPGIPFPDGLTVAPARMREILTSPPARPAGIGARERQGPAEDLTLRWAFDTDRSSPITRIASCDSLRTLLVDAEGTLYCVDAATGKLRWRKEEALSATASRSEGVPADCPPAPLSDGEGRIFVAGPGRVDCLAAEDGRLHWRSEIGAGGRTSMAIVLHEGALLACDPASGAVDRIDRVTGKLLRENVGAAQADAEPGVLRAGADLAGDRWFVYGPRTAILNASTLETEWSFESARVRAFPIELSESSAAPAPTPTPAPAPSPAAGRSRYRMVRGNNGQVFRIPLGATPGPVNSGAAVVTVVIDHLARGKNPWFASTGTARTALGASVVAWVGDPSVVARRGLVAGDRLVLLDGERLLVLPLELPIQGKEIAASGTFLGMSGSVACLLNDKVLTLVRVSDLSRSEVDLSGIRGESEDAFLQGVVDGPAVYVAGPGGVLSVNAATGERLFQAAWPEAVAAMSPGAGVPGMTYILHGLATASEEGIQRWQPMPTCAAGGVLYVAVRPWRVVALGGGGPR